MKKLTYLIVSITLFGCYGREPLKTGLEGKPLPSFRILLADSTTILNTANIPSGKPVALFYFGPHCPFSKAQMEEMVKNMGALSDLHIYLVTPYPYRDMKQFYDHYQLKKFKNITTGVDTTDFFGNYYKVEGFPYIAVYNKEKKLTHAFMGTVKTGKIVDATKE